MTKLRLLPFTLLLFAFSFSLLAQNGSSEPAGILGQLQVREIGPAVVGGRIDDFAVVESNPDIIYTATASGGVWKTSDGTLTWKPIFEHIGAMSIGAIAVAPSNPSVVWVGTGEPNNRQSSSWGDGVYKSVDAGATWTRVGLADSHHIGRIAIDPRNANVVYVAALGHLWGPNQERGLYKTTDGGKNWTRVLFINQDTGVVDVKAGPAQSRHACSPRHTNGGARHSDSTAADPIARCTNRPTAAPPGKS